MTGHVTSHMTGHVLEAREVTRSAFVSSGEPGFVTLSLSTVHWTSFARIMSTNTLIIMPSKLPTDEGALFGYNLQHTIIYSHMTQTIEHFL
jgi:hypothetical protein